MSTKRSFGTIAVIGGLTAVAALLTGVPSVKADELSDLRANNQLLQQRVDQLAQIPGPGAAYPGGPANPAAGQPSLAGSFPRSFLVPGTDTSIRVGGTITLNVMHFFQGANPNSTTNTTTNFGNNGALNTAPLHVHNNNTVNAQFGFALAGSVGRTRGDNVTFISPQQSKLNVESRTPTAWGEARTFMEFDWANGNQFVPGNNAGLSTDNIVPRFRYAYATLGGLLGGQANSNFSDSDASTDNINFGGNVGDPGVTRITQIRYTMPLAGWGIPGAFSVSAESPETDGVVSGGLFASDSTSQNPTFTTCTVAGAVGATCALAAVVNPFKTPAPDLTAAWYIPQPWGHLDFSGLLRPTLQVKDGAFVERNFVGWGVHVSADFKPGWLGWAKDGFTFQFQYGDGIGRYIGGNSTMYSLISNYPATAPASAAAATQVAIKTTEAWSGNAGYTHWWTPTLRTNISGGIQHHEANTLNNSGGGSVCATRSANWFSGGGNCGLNKELISTEANIIWNPVSFADLGLEYFWGHRMVVSGLKGDVSGLISRFRVNF